MIRVNDWFYFLDALDKNTCDKIKSLKGIKKWVVSKDPNPYDDFDKRQEQWKSAAVNVKEDITDKERRTGVKKIHAVDKNIRISDASWTEDQWVYDIIWPYMEEANERAGWKYDIRSAETIQITRYKKG